MEPKQSSLFAHQPPKVIFRLALNRSYTGKRNSLNEPCISEFRGHPSFHGYKLIVVELPPLNRMPLIGSPSCQVSPMPLHTPSPFSKIPAREHKAMTQLQMNRLHKKRSKRMVYNNSYTIYCLLVIIPCLPNTVRSCRRLQIILGIEVTVYKYDSVCRHQIQALATLMENKRLIYKHPYDETQLFLFSLDSAYILCKKR